MPPAGYNKTFLYSVRRIRTTLMGNTIHPTQLKSEGGGRLVASPTEACVKNETQNPNFPPTERNRAGNGVTITDYRSPSCQFAPQEHPAKFQFVLP